MILDELLKQKNVLAYRDEMLLANQTVLWEKYHDLNPLVRPNNLLFVGDSLTEFFPIHELIPTNISIYNRGIRGITSLQLLEHLDDQILELNPKIIFLLIGANDLKTRQSDDVFKTIQEIVYQIKQKLPQTTIYLLSLLPINESNQFKRNLKNRNNRSIFHLNQKLSQLREVIWLDVHSVLINDEGQLPLEYTVDGIHLTIKGYQVLAKLIETQLNKEV